MAITKHVTSDLTGKPVKNHAKISIVVAGVAHVVDADASEVEELISKASRKQSVRGRKPAETATPDAS